MTPEWAHYARTTEDIIDLLSDRADSAQEAAIHLGVALGVIATFDGADIDEAIRIAKEIRDGYKRAQAQVLS